jgi:transposase-like protein
MMARYSDEFRAQAILMLEANGWPERKGALTSTAKHLGLKHPTLSRWARKKQNPPPNELVQEKRFDLIEAIRSELRAIFGELPNARPDADYKELATSAAILIDKLQLLTGEATDRTEVLYAELTVKERVDRVTDLFERARDRRTRLHPGQSATASDS